MAGQDARRDDAESRELYGQFIPIEGELILLPDVGVVESVSLEALSLMAEGPPWLIGLLPWRERRLPVVSFEGLSGRPLPPRGRRSRCVIVNGPGRFLESGLFALLTRGHPQLIGLDQRALRPGELRGNDPVQLLLARVRIGNRELVIPDLEAIEALLATHLERGNPERV